MSYARSLFESKITWAIILILIFYITFIFSEKYARILEMQSYLAELEYEIDDLKRDTELLSEKIDLLNTNQYIEKIAREELDLVKPNEIMFKSIKK
ncbi:MAG TPA: septum formation initiator family protein [Atribacterota bacterium]|nr:septum formation initiator family protein [Atribacterota bacterium]